MWLWNAPGWRITDSWPGLKRGCKAQQPCTMTEQNISTHADPSPGPWPGLKTLQHNTYTCGKSSGSLSESRCALIRSLNWRSLTPINPSRGRRNKEDTVSKPLTRLGIFFLYSSLFPLIVKVVWPQRSASGLSKMLMDMSGTTQRGITVEDKFKSQKCFKLVWTYEKKFKHNRYGEDLGLDITISGSV